MEERMSSRELFTEDWYFLKTPLGTSWEQMRGRQQEFRPVELPHDWLIYQTDDLYENSFGWYRKEFTAQIREGERLQLCFEGVYMDSTVYVNGRKAGDWKYGYSTFVIDITEEITPGKNELIVLVRHQSPNSRWYSGAGIYRKVWLKHCKKVYLPLYGTYVKSRVSGAENRAPYTSPAGMNFLLTISTRAAGALSESTGCRYQLWKDGRLVQELGEVFACPGRESSLEIQAEIVKPLLWSIETPQCYQLVAELFEGDTVYDCQETTIGFRTMEFDPDRGFFLNGENVKVHGVCEHHDLGCLGAAFHKAALRRQFEILKKMGVNGLRTSHNMPAPEFMELADEMGFVVVSEAFDMWERSKTAYDYGRFFQEWAKRDVESWVCRDRNHPSLMMWSIGNEIYDTHADAHGQEITRRLIEYVRSFDSKENAPITIGSNYMPWEGAQNCADIVKYAGYNYGEKYYEAHHKAHPDWIIYGSETASVVQSRGIYHFPLSQSILSDEDEQCSALGNSSTSWGADSIEKCIVDDRDADFSFGQFLWAGFDYIGEPTPYHTKNSYFGQIDTAGFPKDSYYILQAEWTDVRKAPMVHLFPYWDFNPGQMIDVRAATNGGEVELFLNGVSMGKQRIDHAHGSALLGNWRIPYEPGTILAIAYDEEGREIARDSRSSFGDSKSIRLTADRRELLADGEDVCFLTVEMLDSQGRIVENAVDYVTVTVKGAGRLLGLDNGDSTDYDPYKCNTRKLFSGKLSAVVGSICEAGEIEVTVTGQGLESASLTLTAVDVGAPKKSFLEDCQGMNQSAIRSQTEIPVRKLELTGPAERRLTASEREAVIEAHIYPEAAGDAELIWKVVNAAGIEIPTARIQVMEREGSCRRARLTACGDGEFIVRCMAKNRAGRVTMISMLEYRAEGLGDTLLNPYQLITAGLYTDSFGEIGNGNEKGISTARDGDSGVSFDHVDFGEYGSDELTLPVFALDGGEYPIEVWLGKPGEAGSRLIDTVLYQKPSVWNTYQEETWKLPERLCGIQTVGFMLHERKVHLKGFYFTYFEKAFGRLYAAQANRVYGDSFHKNGLKIEKIGNNVTLEYENMDFGEAGAAGLIICGRTPLERNAIHLHFTEEGGETVNRMVEFGASSEYVEQSFAIERLRGRGRLDIIFLPGSQFDLEYVQFHGDAQAAP
ncbi:MAG: DUF4982 domain-containing protein [Roseburia sp.]|nr:DUF4982 domain-containing protein [Roseburia sp.]